MAIQINPGDMIRTTVKFLNDNGSQIQNIYHFLVNGTGASDGDTVAAAVVAWLGNAYPVLNAYLSTSIALYEIVTNLIDFVAAPTPHWAPINNLGTDIAIPAFAPANPGDALAPGISALVRYPTGFSGHEKRSYIAGFTEQHNTIDAGLSALLVGTLATFSLACYTDWPIPGGTLELQPVVPDTDQDLYKFLIASIIPATWHYQRRRQILVGL